MLTERTRNLTFDLPPHGVAALLLNDISAEPDSLNGTCALYYQCSVSEALLNRPPRIEPLTVFSPVAKWHTYLKLNIRPTFCSSVSSPPDLAFSPPLAIFGAADCYRHPQTVVSEIETVGLRLQRALETVYP
jgi:hypothetical protein